MRMKTIVIESKMSKVGGEMGELEGGSWFKVEM